jgi:hypothetical protein
LRQLDLPQVMHWGAPSPDGRHLPAVDLKGNLALVDERVHGQGAPLQQLTAINFAAQSRCEQSVRDSASRELFLDDSVGEIRPDFDPRVLTIWFACQAVGRREGSANHRLSAQLQPVPISPDAPGGACV